MDGVIIYLLFIELYTVHVIISDLIHIYLCLVRGLPKELSLKDRQPGSVLQSLFPLLSGA